MPQYLTTSNLQKKITQFLVDPFNAMTTFFFRRSVEKAFQLDEQPSELTLNINKPLSANPPFITSAVDDVMYIVNQVLQRSLATSQRAVVGTVISTVGRVLSSDFIPMIQRKMRDESYPKAAIQGALPPEDKIVGFLVLINNLDIATDYLKRIIATQLEAVPDSTSETENLKSLFPFANDAVFVANGLRNMEATFTIKTNELLQDGISVTFHQVLKPRIRPMLADAFRDIDYNISATPEDQPASPSSDDHDDTSPADVVPRRFAASWSQLTRPLRRILTPRAFEKLLTTTLPYLSSALEKRLWALHNRVSELGAVRLERDVAGIVAAACGEGRYALRDAFAKPAQICMVAGMEAEEWEEMADEGDAEAEGVKWVLSKAERARARELVVGRG
jgi:conserved oligomeric Golgi complex subunit 4